MKYLKFFDNKTNSIANDALELIIDSLPDRTELIIDDFSSFPKNGKESRLSIKSTSQIAMFEIDGLYEKLEQLEVYYKEDYFIVYTHIYILAEQPNRQRIESVTSDYRLDEERVLYKEFVIHFLPKYH